MDAPPQAVPDRAGAMKIVHRYVATSAAAGLISVPVLDVAALGGVHISLIKRLTEYYGAEFSEHTARNIVIAITASLVPGVIGSVLTNKAMRVLPYVSHVVGIVTMSAFSGAVSYGLGLVFIKHFEGGGTLDSFNIDHLHHVFKRTPA